MWDLKLNNSCNHRIINEKLDITIENSNYIAKLKRPANGNNFNIKIVDQNNLFSTNPKKIKFLLGNDYRTLRFNFKEIDVDIRKDLYPQNSYYATYTTTKEFCPKCIFGTSKTNDFYINILGKPIITSGLELLIQKVKKIIITSLQSNVFDINYGSELPDLIGKPKNALTILKVQSTIMNAINYIQSDQLNNYSILSDDEKLVKMDNFQIMPNTDPKRLNISFEIYTLSGKNVNIGVTI